MTKENDTPKLDESSDGDLDNVQGDATTDDDSLSLNYEKTGFKYQGKIGSGWKIEEGES